jgi:hypothetical protein
METGPVVVGTYGDVMAAHLARLQLETDGVRSVLLDEHLVTAHPLISGAIGGVKVAVAAEDAKAAREILARPGSGHDEAACPACGSTRITTRHAGRRAAFLTILMLGIPIGRARSKVRCEACRNTWRE